MIGDVSRAEHIYIVCGYTDMRKSIDGLAAIVQQNFKRIRPITHHPAKVIPEHLVRRFMNLQSFTDFLY